MAMYFPAPGFIAPLLREQEPRRLFNIISSTLYIIPQQILVYLQTGLKYTDRDEEWEHRQWLRSRRGGFWGGGWWQLPVFVWERGRRTLKNLCVSHCGVKLIQWQTADGGLSPEVPGVSLSLKARRSASGLLCHSFRRGWRHHTWPPLRLSLVPLLRPAGHSQVPFASRKTERGRKRARIKNPSKIHQLLRARNENMA